MSERLQNWISGARRQIVAALEAPSDAERLLEALCAIEALGVIAPLLVDAMGDPIDALALSAAQRKALAALGKLGLGKLGLGKLGLGKLGHGSAGAARGSGGRGPARPEDDGALALVQPIARRGLARLSGAPPEAPVARASVGDRVPEATLLRLVRGELDGFLAEEIARRIAASEAAGVELRLVLGLPPAAEGVYLPPIRLAADGPVDVRDPSTGRAAGSTKVKAADGALELEAFRFEGGVLGIYASSAVTFALAGASDDWSVRGSAPGYLELEQVGEGAQVALRVGDHEVSLKLKRR